MKIGIVGHGAIGRRHSANARKLGHEPIIYDPLGPSDVKFERQVYEKADAVVIATPSHCHEAGFRACVERGKPVLIEKPISTSMGQLSSLLMESFKKKLVVMMGNNLRFHPCVQKAKAWLDQGAIGQPIWAQFICAQKSTKSLYLSDGVILNTGAHEVDLAMHLLGPGKVACASAHFARGDDDIADFVMVHNSETEDPGVMSNVHLDFVSPIPIREFKIIGDEGFLHCDLIHRDIHLQQTDPKLPDVIHADNYIGPGSWDTDYLDEMMAFINRIEGSDTPGASGSDGYVTLHALLDIRKKAGL